MPNPFFRFKEFTVFHDRCAMKVTTDGCLFGAWVAVNLKGKKDVRALDVGTGSGLLSLMVAQETKLFIDAVEIDRTAAQQAGENFNSSPWADRLQVHSTAIQDYQAATQYPYIFSNPPFYEADLMSPAIGRNLAHHGGGLRLNELLHEVKRLLLPEGTVFLLLPYKREQEIYSVLEQHDLFAHQSVLVHPTVAHKPIRIMLALKNCPAENAIQEKMYIKDASNQYSVRFTQLLQDFYLYL